MTPEPLVALAQLHPVAQVAVVVMIGLTVIIALLKL